MRMKPTKSGRREISPPCRDITSLLLSLLCWSLSAFQVTSFVIQSHPRMHHRTVLLDQEDPLQTTTTTTTTPKEQQDEASSVYNWNASGSFGSLLMQMQKKEEAMLAANETALLEDDTIDLDPTTNITLESEEPEETLLYDKEEIITEELSTMDWETARELDESVTHLVNTPESLRQKIQVLPKSELYQALLLEEEPNKTLPILSLSRPEHYRDRIDRDRRLLAISIAASTEQVSQWRLFCQEKGGLFPLLETVREGARSLEQHSQPETSEWLGWHETQEEAFQAACSACRALRDLCAINPEISTVLTDGILRANEAWNTTLMTDFCTMLQYVNEYVESSSKESQWQVKDYFGERRRHRRDARLRCKLYITQLLLAMVVASDDAVTAIRSTDGFAKAILACSSYAFKERRRRWLRYPGEMVKWLWRSKTEKNTDSLRRPFLEAATVADDLNGQVQKTSNQILAAIGYNRWIPKTPGQKGLRILALDGGGARGMSSVTAVRCLVEALGNGMEVSDTFDMIVGTSTGGIISFLTGLRQETSSQALERYNALIRQIFVKSALSTPLMFFTTASYDEYPFMGILSNILGDEIMLDSRADPAVPLVFCVTSKMSSTPTHIALFRNYNYAGGELPDPFVIDPDQAREDLNLPVELEHELIRSGSYTRKKEAVVATPGVKMTSGSRHPGSFRVLQRYALRASTAAPTFFKPVMMGGEMYADGGIVASNPTAVAIHEARTLFPDIPIELVVSIGTGGFLEQKSAPRIGWDGIIGQIVDSATDGEQTHHILEDVLGQPAILGAKSTISKTRYFRFNPIVGLPDEFPIDVTDPEKLAMLRQITRDYMAEPEQRAKLDEIALVIKGRKRRKKQTAQ